MLSQDSLSIRLSVRLSLCLLHATNLEQSAAKSQTTWVVTWPVQAVTEDIFYSDSEATAQCELVLTARNRSILAYLLTLVFCQNGSTFLPPDSHTTLVLQYQTLWQYSDGDP